MRNLRRSGGNPKLLITNGKLPLNLQTLSLHSPPFLRLADEMHRMLTLTLAPSVPTSLRNIPIKYNLIIRLWTHAFHRLLESLRRAAMPPVSSLVALEHLQVSTLVWPRGEAVVLTSRLTPNLSRAFLGIHLLRIHLLCRPPRGAESICFPRPMDRGSWRPRSLQNRGQCYG